jgi:hypothetical protein
MSLVKVRSLNNYFGHEILNTREFIKYKIGDFKKIKGLKRVTL